MTTPSGHVRRHSTYQRAVYNDLDAQRYEINPGGLKRSATVHKLGTGQRITEQSTPVVRPRSMYQAMGQRGDPAQPATTMEQAETPMTGNPVEQLEVEEGRNVGEEKKLCCCIVM